MTGLLAQSAEFYARHGIAVFPLLPRKKEPVFNGGFKTAVTDLGQVTRWWREDQARNIGIATGAPAGFWVLDIDGEAGAASLAALEAEHGALPDTVEQKTARGRHICFAYDPATPVRNSSNRVGKAIDVRGDGGYIVAAPSVHPGDAKKGIAPGWIYQWRLGHGPGDGDPVPAPAWLMALVLKPEPETPAQPARPAPRRRDGRASPYGEAALDGAIATITAAQVGNRDTTLYRTSCSIGRLVASGQIDRDYAMDALISAGQAHVPSAMNQAQLVRQVERALAFAADKPRYVAQGRAWRPGERVEPRPAPAAEDLPSAEALWAASRPAAGSPVHGYLHNLIGRGPVLDGALGRVRAHGVGRFHVMLARIETEAGPTGGVHVTRLAADGGRVVMAPGARARSIVGNRRDEDGRPGGVWLSACGAGGGLLVGLSIEATLAAGVMLHDQNLALAATLNLQGQQGGYALDRYGRVAADAPAGDPFNPPFIHTPASWARVLIAVDQNMPPTTVRARRASGGTYDRLLPSADRARICAGLAMTAWKRAGAAQVSAIAPAAGRDFVDELRERGRE